MDGDDDNNENQDKGCDVGIFFRNTKIFCQIPLYLPGELKGSINTKDEAGDRSQFMDQTSNKTMNGK